MKDLVVVGSLAFDSISTPSGKVTKTLGGSANYFSLVASLLAKVRVVGVVGTDYTDDEVQVLKAKDVDTSGIKVLEGSTFHWEGKYEEDLNEAITLATELNVLAQFKPQLDDNYKKSSVVFLANIDPELQLDVLNQVENPYFIACDTMNFWIETKKKKVLEVLSKVDAILLNETESLLLTKAHNAIEAAPLISETGPKVVIIKRGEYGFLMFTEGKYFILPAYPISKVTDPTGAGDSFAGGFVGHIASLGRKPNIEELKTACMMGTVAASFTVEDFGMARLKPLNLNDLKSRLDAYNQIVAAPKS